MRAGPHNHARRQRRSVTQNVVKMMSQQYGICCDFLFSFGTSLRQCFFSVNFKLFAHFYFMSENACWRVDVDRQRQLQEATASTLSSSVTSKSRATRYFPKFPKYIEIYFLCIRAQRRIFPGSWYFCWNDVVVRASPTPAFSRSLGA